PLSAARAAGTMGLNPRAPRPRPAKRSRIAAATVLPILAGVAAIQGVAGRLWLSAASPGAGARAAAAQTRGGAAFGRRAPAPWASRWSSRVALLAEYDSMMASELKELCKKKGLKVSGTKKVLIERLQEADSAPAPAPKAKAAAPAPAPKAAAPAPAPAPKAAAPAPAPAPKASPKTDALEPGDRISARYHRDNQVYPGILLEIQDGGKYLMSWDEPDDNEPLTSVTEVQLLRKAETPLESGNKQVYHVGDKVFARFPEDNGMYEADLLELNGDRCKIKWDDPDGSPPTAEMPVHDIKLKLRNPKVC
ncbi:unnamed protein product, partial [Prorocentrum cordatum]